MNVGLPENDNSPARRCGAVTARDVHDDSSTWLSKKRIPSCVYEIPRELTTPTPLSHWHKYSLNITFSPVGVLKDNWRTTRISTSLRINTDMEFFSMPELNWTSGAMVVG